MSFPRYPKYKDSGVEWLGEVPEHWDVKPVKSLASIVNGYPFDSTLFDAAEGYPLIRIRDINKFEAETYYKGEFVETAAITSDDVLIGMDGDFNVGRWRGQGRALLNQRMCCVRGRSGLLTRLLEYSLPIRLKAINDITYATTVKHLASSQVEKTFVAIPPDSAEQTQIAAFLDRETAKIDELVAEQRRLMELLKEKRQAVISHAVTQGLNPDAPMKPSGIEWLGDVPAHWEVKRLRFVANLNPSKSEVANLDRDTVVSFLPMTSIGEDGAINLESEKTIGELESGYTYFRDGDVTIAKITPCYENGKGALMTGLVNGIGFGTTELIVARPNPNRVAGAFLHFLFISTVFRDIGESHMYGAGGQKRVPDDFVRNFATAFPPLVEQTQITAFLDSELAKFDTLTAEAQRAIDLLQERRTALISAAVTGQIDVRPH
jgi:type I restriction enzyme S subunit